MKKHSVKNERINAEMQRELSRILREEVKDPRIPVMISVTAAQVAPDLKTCKAYVSVLGDEETVEETKAALKSAAGFIRHEVAVNLNLRLTPEISFIMDNSIAYGSEMSQKIDEVMADLGMAPREAEPVELPEGPAAPEADFVKAFT